MPGAEWVGPHHDNGNIWRYDAVCIHTIVGVAPAHAAHFSVRGDGHIYQSRDTKYQSAANYQGNPRIIAIENADRDGSFSWWNKDDGHAVPFLTDAQVESNAQICAWVHKTHSVPLVACPDSRPTSKGIAYHRQGIKGNWAGYVYGGIVSGGEVWTKSDGKVCPGDRRISQIPEIIARARSIVGLTAGGEDMSVRLVRGDSTETVPGKPYTFGNLEFLVKFSTDLPKGAVRKYLSAGGVEAVLDHIQGGAYVVPQAALDQIPFAPGGEIPHDVLY
jgi:hypothetical protein